MSEPVTNNNTLSQVEEPLSPPDRTRVDITLDNAALVLSTITGLAGLFNPGVAATGALAGKLLSVISAGVKAHEAITGQPLDLTKLHHIDLIE